MSGAPSTAHAAVTGRGLLESTRAVAGLVGLGAARPTIQVVAGAIVHTAVSTVWGLAGACVLPRRHPVVVGAAAAFGVGVADLAVGRRCVPALRALPLVPQLADHLLFGGVAGAVIARRRRLRERAAEVVE